MLTLVRAIVELLLQHYSVQIASSDVQSDAWDFVGAGSVLGLPISLAVLIVIAIIGQFILTRLRIGWRIAAVGGSRRAAYNVGIPVRSTVCLSYVVSGTLTSLAGVLYAARLSGVGPDTGVGLELTVVTAALLGGNSVGGGRGSIGKALMGAIIVSLLFNGLVRLGLESGAAAMAIGIVLLLAISIDVRWGKWRKSLQSKVYVSPGYLALPPAPSVDVDSSSPYAMNDRLGDAEIIGLGQVDGPEDVILDTDDNIYCQRAARRHRPLSRSRLRPTRSLSLMSAAGRSAWPSTRTTASLVCIAGMGLYRVDKHAQQSKS